MVQSGEHYHKFDQVSVFNLKRIASILNQFSIELRLKAIDMDVSRVKEDLSSDFDVAMTWLGSFIICFATQFFVPKHDIAKSEDVEKITEFLVDKPRILIGTGAGISTESGNPDYRSEGVGLYQRQNHKPIQHPEFFKSDVVRKRYWARNFLGWPKFSNIEPKPNATHYKLARMERDMRLSHIVSHISKEVTELHGNGFKVISIGKGERDNACTYSILRHDFQLILNQLNPSLLEKFVAFDSSPEKMKPDGDIEISQEDIDMFYLPECPQCGGFLKPNIVFFGDNVPRPSNILIGNNLMSTIAAARHSGTKYSKPENLHDSPSHHHASFNGDSAFMGETVSIQQRMLQSQDEQLDVLSDSIGTLKTVSRQIGIEVDEQAVMLDATMRKMGKVLNLSNNDRRQWMAILALSLLLLVVIILFIIL